MNSNQLVTLAETLNYEMKTINYYNDSRDNLERTYKLQDDILDITKRYFQGRWFLRELKENGIRSAFRKHKAHTILLDTFVMAENNVSKKGGKI